MVEMICSPEKLHAPPSKGKLYRVTIVRVGCNQSCLFVQAIDFTVRLLLGDLQEMLRRFGHIEVISSHPHLLQSCFPE